MAKKTTKKVQKKYYILLDKSGRDTAVIFHNRSPRAAALKAAARGNATIALRERKRLQGGLIRVHTFKGKREQISAPKGAPKWLGSKVWKAGVKKVGVER
ncbi:MAG: hypothetical protein CVU81_03240, partial [Euryarchaeota archaeon HGW-Euryarchaeota-1]